MPENDMKKLNPQITDGFVYGIRGLQELTIYPLSVGDQLKMTELIQELATKYFMREDDTVSDMEFIKEIIEFIQNNLKQIVKLVVDREINVKDVLYDMTNNQAIVLAEIIYKVNYESLAKNVKSLVEKIAPKQEMELTPSARPSPTSVNDTDIDLEISSDPSEMEE